MFVKIKHNKSLKNLRSKLSNGLASAAHLYSKTYDLTKNPNSSSVTAVKSNSLPPVLMNRQSLPDESLYKELMQKLPLAQSLQEKVGILNEAWEDA